MPSILQLLLGGSQAVPVDPFFYSVTSLLHGDGTNGAQNNTFLDSSTNNFTITRNGNTTQGSYSPFSQTGWGNYFNGSSYYYFASNAAFNFDTYSTIEFWVNFSELSADQLLAGRQNQSWVSFSYGALGVTASKIGFSITADNGSSWTTVSSSTTPTIGQWYHIAAVRDNTTLRLYINGTQEASTAFASTPSSPSNPFKIGGFDTSTLTSKCYLSNVRYVKGSTSGALPYSGNFTPPTAPLSAITGTQLLTAQSNRFVDNSTNAFAITVGGSPSVQAFSPFNPTTAYSTSTVGGSGYFDGSGDYLTVPDSNNLTLSGDFTVEFWFYATTAPSTLQTIISKWSALGQEYIILLNTNYGLAWYWGPANNSNPMFNSSNNAYRLNEWTHVAVVRSGSTHTMYVNGVSVGTGTNGTNGTNGPEPVYIGVYDVSNYYFPGYISGVRIVNGTAVYTSAFTPPTAPLTAITNTQLLCNFTNAGIFDNAADADYETVGNAQISTSVKKYGTGSMAFDGSGDYLRAPYSPNVQMGTGDFTVEAWVYLSSAPVDYGLIFNIRNSTAQFSPLQVYIRNSRIVDCYFSTNGSTNSNLASTGTVPLTTWTHVAVVRVSGVVFIYINGTRASSALSLSGSLYQDTTWGSNIGGESGGNPFIGYIDDLRISKGVGRYPYNFTPPTAEFPNIGGTVTLTADPYFYYTTLLLPGNGTNGAQNNTFLDSSTNAFSITRNGNTTQGTFSPFSQTGWGAYFDGTGDYLSTNATQAIPATGDFTIEAWVYPTVSGAGRNVVSQGTSGSSGRLQLNVHTDNTLQFGITSTLVYSTGTVTPNAWNYIAVTRTGSSVSFYINNGPAGTATLSGTVQNTALWIGAEWSGDPYRWLGYISNVRISNVVRAITAAPTAAFTSDANTVVLTCQSNRFIDNSTNAYTITRNGDVSVQAFSPFNPTAAWSAATYGGSGYFDGSGDYLQIANSSAYSLDGDFTIEGWFNGSNYGSTIVFFQLGEVGSSGIEMWVSTASATLRASVAGSTMISSDSMVPSQWTHFALVRSGTGSNNISLYANGKRQAQLSSNNTFTGTANNGIRIGAEYPTATPWNGYLSDIRVLKGTAQYSGTTYTIPTAPLTAVSGTQLLCNFTNAGIYDATSKNDLETVGNAQISTAQSKFGGSSMLFDGTGDWLRAPSGPITSLEGDFTAEGWVYLSSTAAAWPVFTVGDSNGSTGIELYRATSNGKWRVYSNNTSQIDSTTSTGTESWVHLAVTRYSGVVKLFVNGINEGSTWSTTGTFSGAVYVGAEFYGGSVTVAANGYIQDLRITKGIARYTSNFTPPTTAFLTL